jgi:hypothetical protein
MNPFVILKGSQVNIFSVDHERGRLPTSAALPSSTTTFFTKRSSEETNSPVQKMQNKKNYLKRKSHSRKLNQRIKMPIVLAQQGIDQPENECQQDKKIEETSLTCKSKKQLLSEFKGRKDHPARSLPIIKAGSKNILENTAWPLWSIERRKAVPSTPNNDEVDLISKLDNLNLATSYRVLSH